MVEARKILPFAALAAALYTLARPAPRVEAAAPTAPPPPVPQPIVTPPPPPPPPPIEAPTPPPTAPTAPPPSPFTPSFEEVRPCQPGPPPQCPGGFNLILGSDCRYYCVEPNAPGVWYMADAFKNARYIVQGSGVDPVLGGCVIVCYMDGSTYGTNCPDDIYFSETRKCFGAARA
jgi:hypothetical protein